MTLTTPPPDSATAPEEAVVRIEGARRRIRGDAAGPPAFEIVIPGLTLHIGASAVLSGPSGSGKSLALELIGLAAAASEANLHIMQDGKEMFDVRAATGRGAATALAGLRARRIGFMLQNGALLPFLTVRENALLAQRFAGREDKAYLDALLDRLGLGAKADRTEDKLSIGERQRAALARALAHRPALILADEPTAALDPALKAEVAELIVQAAAGLDAAALIVTHEAWLYDDLPVTRCEMVPDATAGHPRSILRPAP